MFLFFSLGLSNPTFSVSITTCNINGDGEVTKTDYRDSGAYGAYTTVNIGTGIEKIQDWCFAESKALQAINFIEPSSVTSIGDNAFENCGNLLSITFPDSVKEIGEYVLKYCNLVQTVPLGAKLESIGIPVLYSESFKSFIVSPSNTKFSNDSYGCLYDKNKTILYQVPSLCDPAYKVPETVLEIKSECFHGVETLPTIFISRNVNKINTFLCNYNYKSQTMIFEEGINIAEFPNKVFIRWIGLVNIELPESLISIPSGCFEGCSNLKSIFIPKTVGNIAIDGFTGCSLLDNITIANDNSYFQSVNGAVFSDDLTELLILPTSITSISIPSNCTKLPTTALQYATKLQNVTIDPDNEVYQTDGYGLIYKNNFKTLFICIGGVTNANVCENTTTINDYAFNSIQYINEIDRSNTNVETIGQNVFQNSKIKVIKLPKTLTAIKNYAFDNCALTTIVIHPETIKNITISSYAFRNTNDLNSMSISNIVTITEHSFLYSGIETIEFVGSSLTTISPYAFEYSKIKRIHFPDSLQTIGSLAFQSCTKLESIIFGKYIQAIYDYAFSQCTLLNNITFPNDCTLDKIDQGAFSSTALVSVELPPLVSDISYSSFQQCNNLISVHIENSTFYSTSDGILYNENSTTLIFCPAGKTTANIHSSVEIIGTNAFYGCEKLATLTFPLDGYSSLKQIGENTFYHCISLKNVTFPESLQVIQSGAFEGCTNLTTLIFGENGQLQSIGANIFHGCEKLEIIHLPINGVLKEISDNSFENCLNLQEITIPNAVIQLGNSCFMNCPKLSKIVFSRNESQLKKIDSNAFKGCTSIKFFDFPSNLISIGSSAFVGTSLQNVEIPPSVRTLSDSCFQGILALKNVKIAEGLTQINDSCFEGCSLLTIILPSTLTYLGNDAFANCKKLYQVFYCGRLNFSTTNAFRNTDSRLHVNVRHLFEFDTFSQSPILRTLTEKCIYIPPNTDQLLQKTPINLIPFVICIMLNK